MLFYVLLSEVWILSYVVLQSLFLKTNDLTGTRSPVASELTNIVQRFSMLTVGIEVAKTSIVVCILDHIPSDPKKYARTYKAITFQSSKESFEALAKLGDLFLIEPTGVYSRIWFEYLTNVGKDVRKVSPKRITHTRRERGIENKTDRYDAFALALYGQLYHADPSQFLAEHAEELRDLTLTHKNLTKASGQLSNRIWRNLAYEWPEACISKTGKKPHQFRLFLDESPPALYRFLAGQQVTARAKRERELSETIGAGISSLTQLYARHVCDLERAQFEIEQQIAALLQCSEFESYSQVFDLYDFGPMTRAAILSRVFPIERFLGENNRPIVQHVYTDKSRSKRYVSLGSFKLALGMGTVFKQSGNSTEEKPGGASYARSALFQHCKVKIVMRPPKDLSQSRRVEHRRYYEEISQNRPHNQAVMKLAAKICKDLFRDLTAAL